MKHPRASIVALGSKIFRKQGYYNTGIQDILDQGQLPKGSFYNYFNSKESFAIEVINSYGKELHQQMSRMLRRHRPGPLARIQEFYQWTLEINRKEDYKQGCLLANSCMELAGQESALALCTAENFEKLATELSHCIKEGQEKGGIRKDISAQELAHYVHQGFFGSLARMKSRRNAVPVELQIELTVKFLTSN